jgi:hypothetical protein
MKKYEKYIRKGIQRLLREVLIAKRGHDRIKSCLWDRLVRDAAYQGHKKKCRNAEIAI